MRGGWLLVWLDAVELLVAADVACSRAEYGRVCLCPQRLRHVWVCWARTQLVAPACLDTTAHLHEDTK